MGCPTIYYRECIYYFASRLLKFERDNANKIKQFLEDNDISKLEKFIIEKKECIPKEKFFYYAGMTSQSILDGANKNDGCDGFNACIGGILEFQNFIGIEYDWYT